MDTAVDDPNYQKAAAKVKKIKGFYGHLATYILVNIILVGINFFTSPGVWWFYWVTFVWGIWVVWDAIHTFVITEHYDVWEEKKIKEYMEKAEKKTEMKMGYPT